MITVVGSIAYDAVETPFGARERMLGGAASHFALAASFFDEVRVVGPIGSDFAASDLAILETRGTRTDDVELIADQQTFFWRGEYDWDLNSRRTLETRLNAFEYFQPKLSSVARNCDLLFLANITPKLQRSVLDQCAAPRWTALDSMDLWIATARDDLVVVIERVDCVILNDAELRQLADRPSILGAAREVLSWGPTAVVAKQGEYGATLVTTEGFFSLPAFPLEEVVDPTGAGDTFAGGLLGFVAAHREQAIDHELLSRAMAYGTALASFNVEGFGTERVARLIAAEVRPRVAELRAMTRFKVAAVELVG